MTKNRYTVEVMTGFARETENGLEMPETSHTATFKAYHHAKAFYREIKKENKNAVHFYRNNELITFKGK